MTENEYIQTRVSYAIVRGEVVFQDSNNRKPTKDWLLNDVCLSEEEYNKTISGRIFSDRVLICMGDSYGSVNMEEINSRTLVTIFKRHYEIFGDKAVKLHNGCKPGAIAEDWEPIESLGLFRYCPEACV